MALIAQETIVAVKSAADIVEIVSSRMELKRAGSSLKGLCPFHDEKTPSFNVSPQRQHFHCFGCGKGGDALSFIMDYERVDYPEAIRMLADRYNVPVRYADGSAPEFSRSDLVQVNTWAAGVFRGLLKTAEEAEGARAFLAGRGVSEASLETFGLGFSMDSWDYLLARGKRAGYSEKLMAAAGLLVEKEDNKGRYDRFRGRLMFPIANASGQIIGFGARTLGEDTPKFINTPETAIFSKGKGFYGLHLARPTIEEKKTVFIVEGYMDVIIPHQAGILGLVATLGTALTRDHIRVLKRHATKVVLVFDSDAAGQRASERGLDMLLAEDVDIFVAELPSGKDPDDVVVKEGAAALEDCLSKPREIFEFLLTSLSAKHGTSTPAAKARIVQEMLERVSEVRDPIKEEILVRQISEHFSISEKALRSRITHPAPEEPQSPPLSAMEAAARDLLACAVTKKAVAKWVRLGTPISAYPPRLRDVAAAAYRLYDGSGEVDGRALMIAIDDQETSRVAADVLSVEIADSDVERRARVAFEVLVAEALRGNPLAPEPPPEDPLRAALDRKVG